MIAPWSLEHFRLNRNRSGHAGAQGQRGCVNTCCTALSRSGASPVPDSDNISLPEPANATLAGVVPALLGTMIQKGK